MVGRKLVFGIVQESKALAVSSKICAEQKFPDAFILRLRVHAFNCCCFPKALKQALPDTFHHFPIHDFTNSSNENRKGQQYLFSRFRHFGVTKAFCAATERSIYIYVYAVGTAIY